MIYSILWFFYDEYSKRKCLLQMEKSLDQNSGYFFNHFKINCLANLHGWMRKDLSHLEREPDERDRLLLETFFEVLLDEEKKEGGKNPGKWGKVYAKKYFLNTFLDKILLLSIRFSSCNDLWIFSIHLYTADFSDIFYLSKWSQSI